MATTLHKIVTGMLLKKRLPIHFYIEFLTYCAAGLRELQFDTMGNIQTLKLPINSYGAVTVPCGMLDIIKLGIPNGQYVRPLASRIGMNRLNNYDDNGTIIPYDADNFFTGFCNGYAVHHNENWENTGRFYGNRGNGVNTFIWVKERNEIQINIAIQATEVILEFITDGSECDNATKVNAYAIATLEAYANWQETENKRGASEFEKSQDRKKFDHEHGLLRARLNPLTVADIKYIWNRNNHGSIK